MMNEELKDALGELINISFGSATAMIADLFDSFATLNVPDIELVPIGEIETIIMEGSGFQEIYITGQQFKGTFSGEVVFAIDKKSAENMQYLICPVEKCDENQPCDESEIQQSILEISNIIGSSCVGKFVEILKGEVLLSPPTLELTQKLMTGLDKTQFSNIIVIRTVLEFQDVKIFGRLFIMFNNEMFIMLKKALKVFMEEL
jgi:chemotaxis protein CheC